MESNVFLPPCAAFNQHTLDILIITILKKSFRDGIPALIWMNREIMIALIHQAIALIERVHQMLIVVPDELLRYRRLYVVGSLDGDLSYLVTLLKQYKMPPKSFYIFLGDYLDCFNPSRVDALLLLLSLKLRYPRHLYLFRGHHETYEMCRAIGFDKISADHHLTKSFILLFEYMPLVGVFGEFLCLHSGISPFMPDGTFLYNFVKPIEVKRMTARERCVLTDILYGVPDEDLPTLFAPSNVYPIGNRFGPTALKAVLESFECSRLIRGCGCRESCGFKFDFKDKECISIVSGCSAKHAGHERFLVQIFEEGDFTPLLISTNTAWNTRTKHSLTAFIQYCTHLLKSTRNEYYPPPKCVACGWISQGKRCENVTISHTLLKSLAEAMMFPRKLHDQCTFDPRIEQYLYVELFPMCRDFYYHGSGQLIVPFTYSINEYPLIKPPMCKLHGTSFGSMHCSCHDLEESVSDTQEFEVTCVYSDRIVRPGYDLESLEQDLLHLRKRQHWIRGIAAPSLSYKYRVEQLPIENNESE
uniref:protein-serine/threonine phosphatase n=1 Tax=Setaria digitata TaxID=48799 RepID=A0A915Q8B1_9BILA